jgi:hypothetical protein
MRDAAMSMPAMQSSAHKVDQAGRFKRSPNFSANCLTAILVRNLTFGRTDNFIGRHWIVRVA